MTSTLITLAAGFGLAALLVLALDAAQERRKRRDREIVRRIQRYLGALPPARPW